MSAYFPTVKEKYLFKAASKNVQKRSKSTPKQKNIKKEKKKKLQTLNKRKKEMLKP
jgi:hypothetical protein